MNHTPLRITYLRRGRRSLTHSVILRVAAAAIAISASGAAATLFEDSFTVTGNHLDYSKWTTEIGQGSFLGRTQLADWVTPGGVGVFAVTPTGAQLTLSTYNPTGVSLFGTHAKTLQTFQPTPNTAIQFTTRLQLTSLQPGIVYGMYLYGCQPGQCANKHDEVDIELLTNLLQPGSPLQVNFNSYADEPLGAGHPAIVLLPAGFDPLAVHDWTIWWTLNTLRFSVDGVQIYETISTVPKGPMTVNEIAWGPASDWPTAYSSSLQAVADAMRNQSYTARLQRVTVTEEPRLPEPGTWATVLFGCGLLGAVRRWRAVRR